MKTEGLYDRGYLVDHGDGELILHRNLVNYRQSVNDVYHVITAEDTLHSIARERYGSSSLWFMIADVNRDIEDIFDLIVGDTILIPSVPLIQSRYAGIR